MKNYINGYTGILICIFFIIGVGACGDGHSHGKDDGHDGHHHNETLQLTSYNGEYELFAEASPFSVGQESDVVAHFTRLSDFKPLESGKVRMSLETDGGTQSVTADKPGHTGIYRFKLTPDKPGKGRLVFELETESGRSSIAVTGITVYPDEHEAHHAAAEAAAHSSNGIVFPKEQSWKVDFSTEEVRSAPFGEVIRTMAQVEPSQGDERVVVARTSGTVRLSGNDLVEGKAVANGQLLFSIDSEGMADNNMSVRYREARSAYEFAKSEYDRKKELAGEQLVTQGDLLKAKNEYETAEAAYSSLRKNFAAGRHSEGSPIAGFIKKMYVGNGEYVEAGTPVVAVAQNKRLNIRAELQPRKFHSLGNIVSANIRMMNDDRVYSLKELNGSLVSYGKGVDADNPLIPVVFQVDNTVDLLPGSFVEMFMTTGNGNALTVPDNAIVEEMGNYFVFVQLTPEFFEKREVKIGQSDGERTQVLSGVREGERVVGKGAVLVKLAQVSGQLDAHAGHVH